MKISIDKIDLSKLIVSGIRAGQVTIGKIESNTTKNANVTFSESLVNENYSVVITSISGGNMWVQVKFSARNKTRMGL